MGWNDLYGFKKQSVKWGNVILVLPSKLLRFLLIHKSLCNYAFVVHEWCHALLRISSLVSLVMDQLSGECNGS